MLYNGKPERSFAFIDNVWSLLILNAILLILDIRGYFKKDSQKIKQTEAN